MAINKFEIIVPQSHTEFFTYKADDVLDIKPGDYVIINFRNKKLLGICFKISVSILEDSKIKLIDSKLDIKPVKHSFLKFIEWVAIYSMSSLGDILKMSVPKEIEAKPKTEYKYILGEYIYEKLSSKRKKLIDILSQNHRSVKELNLMGFSNSFLCKLCDLRILKKTPYYEEKLFNNFELCSFPILSELQNDAVKNIEKYINKKIHKTILLQGVTGSGKTEVYFTIMKNILSTNDGQILILLPEIMLATQVIARVKARFGLDPDIWHSDISKSRKRKTWHNVVNGRSRIIIGARSALFLPFSNLALIIIDEEHESSYKQEEGVIYHARDMAIIRASQEQIPVILASATPSLETLYNVSINKYDLVDLPTRYSEVDLPEVEVIDMKSEKLPKFHWISNKLKQTIIDITDQDKQVMLFLNRRGYAPITLCLSCGYRFTCNNCSACLVEHRSKNILECHHCGYNIPKPIKCSECNEENRLMSYGPGVERIAEEVESIDPNFRIIVITKDSLIDINHAKNLIKDIEDNKYNIIIGTQIIAKGLHFPNLLLVGIIDADIGLFGGDLRASEKHFQLLNQLGGRAGRENIRGKVIVQTFNPDNSIIKALKHNNTKYFLNIELDSRKENKLPPYGKLAAIILSSLDEDSVRSYANELVRLSPSSNYVKILGPVAAILSKIRNKYRYRILVKADKKINIQKYLRFWFAKIEKNYKITVKIDIDPYNFY